MSTHTSQPTVHHHRRVLAVTAAVLLVVVAGCSTSEREGVTDPVGSVDASAAPAIVPGPVTDTCPLWGDVQIPDSYLPVDVQSSDTGTDVDIRGHVVVSSTCEAVAGAKIEFWHSDPAGKYHPDKFRGWFRTESTGRFELTLTSPGRYEDAPPHVHLLVSVGGYAPRVFTVDTTNRTQDVLLVLESKTVL